VLVISNLLFLKQMEKKAQALAGAFSFGGDRSNVTPLLGRI
jgi:hypothetical protein